MVFEEQFSTNADEASYAFGSTSSLAAGGGGCSDDEMPPRACTKMMINDDDNNREEVAGRSFKMPYQQSFRESDWSQLAEATLPLKLSRYLTTRDGRDDSRRLSTPYNLHFWAPQTGYGALGGPLNHGDPAAEDKDRAAPSCAQSLDGDDRRGSSGSGGAPLLEPWRGHALTADYQAGIESRSRQISRRLILVNAISLLINLLLALVAFYFSFTNNSSSTTAFAADCVLDFISGAIVLWRYHGDLSDVYMHAREQIACIYLGALFELSALGIIIKASSDIASGVEPGGASPGYDLIYLAAVATIACSILIVFKWSLYRTIRDASILLDVINTFVSTIFALMLCLMTVLSNVDSSFWYLDPILSIVLALFMGGFGLKVIHQNFHVLRPGYQDDALLGGSPFAKLPLLNRDHERGKYAANLGASLEQAKDRANWQKADYSSIAFV